MTGLLQLLHFWNTHQGELFAMLARHVWLVLVATGLATAIGVPLGVLAAKRPGIGRPLVGLTNLVQTIPSLALFGFLLPLPFIGGVGARTALVALVLYGILPILQTTAAGIGSVDRALVQAATAMGLTARQRLLLIEIPLALPSMLAGIRVSTVVGVGTATIAAAIGAGGLGEYIFRGLAMVDATVILAGAIPAAALALVADSLLAWIGRRASDRHRRWFRRSGTSASTPSTPTARIATAIIAIAAVGFIVAFASYARRATAATTIVVGSKNFTEQIVLGELLAQTIERQGGFRVERKLNLGGTLICERALASGDIDAYVEYSGTALTAIFKQPVIRDRQAVLDLIRDRYAASGRTLLEPLGFNNTFAILVRGDVSRSLQLHTISDAVPHAREWRAGFGYEFLEREDGFKGLARTYGLAFREPPHVMDLNLSYRALASGQVDLIAGDATAGAIAALDLHMLEDDKAFFPPYDAVPVIRSVTLLANPALGEGLHALAGRINEETMRKMNEAVDIQRRDPAQVVREFLERERKK
jgi:osmoprotectant transport system permease protein